MSDKQSFAAVHAWDRNFFLVFIILCWLGVVMGFAPASIGRMQGKADYEAPLILHIHAVSFIGWLLLLTVQTLLIRASRRNVHQKLGWIAVLLIPTMAASGILAEVYSQRFYLLHPPNSLNFFIIPIFYTIAFAALASAAFLSRKDIIAHKRLIYLATTIIVGAAYARWWGDALMDHIGDGHLGMLVHTYAATNLSMAIAVGYDLLTRKSVHVVYVWWVPAIVAGEIITTLAYHSPTWVSIALQIVSQ